MYYLYLLRSDSTGKFYIGSSPNLKQRFYQHNRGLN
ncbi:GIY-YIG nuclease family protein, partial [Candidatus Microgenomates bacterium]|nr:GIY-YIG nuclease family protein [Candidatus Microgenomates bacterium]